MDVGPSPVVLDHCRRPGGNNDGHIRYRLIIDVVADINAVILAIVIIIVVVIEQRRILHAHQPLCAPPQRCLQHPDQARGFRAVACNQRFRRRRTRRGHEPSNCRLEKGKDNKNRTKDIHIQA